jgi:Mlc titration factor MtfA (ptsG expression regulator)
MVAAYEDFCRRVDAAPLFDDAHDDNDVDLDSVLDPYATTHPGEFFAVATEAFFTAAVELKVEYPALYREFCKLYRQDPAARSSAEPNNRGANGPAAPPGPVSTA